jgi:hypothetical protein
MNKATVERRDSNKRSFQNSFSVAIVGSLSEDFWQLPWTDYVF